MSSRVQTACFLYQDLKPANILVSAENYFTLIDFGAVTLRLHGPPHHRAHRRLCDPQGMRRPRLRPPTPLTLTPRFDLYTLGATLWHAVTGCDPRNLGEPFPRLTPQALHSHPITPGFVHIITKALSADLGARYQSAAAMRKDVMAALRAQLGAG